jgi:hypothetical protein
MVPENNVEQVASSQGVVQQENEYINIQLRTSPYRR